jgi:hypothetical protein
MHFRLDRGACAGAVAVLALSTAIAVLALRAASGVTALGGDSYRTEFISSWWWTAFLLVPVPVVLARRWPRSAAVPVLALVLPQVVAAAVCVSRYRSSGWGDGLEALAFVQPLLLLALTAVLVAVVRRPT